MALYNAYSFLGSRTFIGLSSITGITVVAGQVGTVFKHGGGGTLWCGGPSLAVNTSYLMSTGEAINIDNSGTVYFTASGATCTLYTFLGKSSGYEP